MEKRGHGDRGSNRGATMLGPGSARWMCTKACVSR
ncbi:hypothetical protein XHC_2028 [Xanthomonas hortorum pv. carotae str. M081]|nr:hypothetical protein XHC_2028 [Xanthomonas hortorum pv. carotae str. M081]